MKYLAIIAAAATLLLSGCATTLSSNVTAFNDWPANLPDKSYVFETPPPAMDTLEYHSYQVMVANELGKLGFRMADNPAQAKLRVGMLFSTTDVPVRVVYLEDPFGGFGGWGYGRYPFGPRFGYGYGYRSAYWRDPFPLSRQYVAEEQVRHQFERKLRVTINATDGRKLYDVTVANSSRVQATPTVMPVMVQSAFAGFPGPNGVPRRIDITLDPQTTASAQNGAPAKVN
jgi:hypothetical protein